MVLNNFKNKGLGKGLAALLGESDVVEKKNRSKF